MLPTQVLSSALILTLTLTTQRNARQTFKNKHLDDIESCCNDGQCKQLCSQVNAATTVNFNRYEFTPISVLRVAMFSFVHQLQFDYNVYSSSLLGSVFSTVLCNGRLSIGMTITRQNNHKTRIYVIIYLPSLQLACLCTMEPRREEEYNVYSCLVIVLSCDCHDLRLCALCLSCLCVCDGCLIIMPCRTSSLLLFILFALCYGLCDSIVAFVIVLFVDALSCDCLMIFHAKITTRQDFSMPRR